MYVQHSGIIIGLSVIATLITSFVSVSAIELNTGDTTNNFTKNLKSKINDLISNALNDTDNILNSSYIDTDNILNSSFITNGSNLTSSNVMISNNKVASIVSSNGSGGSSSSMIKDEVKTINGICSSIKVGGNGNDTLASSGKCNDELTGGPGADKFMCGDGNDSVRDYNSKEDDVILDRQNCEKIL